MLFKHITSAKMDQQKAKLCTILRSLIISSNPQDGMCLRKLLKDYKELEGVPLEACLPIFDCESVVKFLHSTGEFDIENFRGELIIRAKTNARSKHISKLVSEQNRPRAGRLPTLHRSRPSAQNRLPTIGARRLIPRQCDGASIKNQDRVSEQVQERKKAQTIVFSFEELKLKNAKRDADNDAIESPKDKYSSFKGSCAPSTTASNVSSTICSDLSSEVSFDMCPEDMSSYASNQQMSRSCQTDNEIVYKFSDATDAVSNDWSDLTQSIDFYQLSKLELPWDEEYWSVLITCCTSTTEIWGRLYGKHCQFDPMTRKVQANLLANRKATTSFNIGQIHLTIIRGNGHRILVENVDHSKKQILCFFIDKGDRKWLEMNEIYDCQSAFIKCPAQAIRFSLQGFEVFPIGNNATARKCIETFLLDKPLTAQIFTKKEHYHPSSGTNSDDDPVIQVAFRGNDTSSDISINLHREIVNQMYDSIDVPELTSLKLTPVTVSHITDNGDIFCQTHANGLQYVEKLIGKFVRKVSNNPFLPSQNLVDVSNNNLFVVYDKETNKLYRAKVVSATKGGNKMFFVDYGPTKTIPLTKMYYVESEHEEIVKFPPQAIRTKLSGMDKVAVGSLVPRLRSRFSLKGNAYVKNMQSNAIIPEVKLYIDVQSFMVCVNDSFELECERNQIINSNGNGTLTRYNPGDVADVSDDITSRNDLIDDTKTTRSSFTSVTTCTIEAFPLPKLRSSFEIVIIKTENPSNFVIKPIEYMSLWQKQMKILQRYCKESVISVPLDAIKEGVPYACLKSNGYWYRAFIKFHRTKMYAFFCDIADIDTITDAKKIKALPQEFRNIPKLAITAKLFGIEPINGTWDMDDNVQFNRITKGKRFQAEVAKVTSDAETNENSMLEIRLIFDNGCINDLFVESGRAVRMCESRRMIPDISLL